MILEIIFCSMTFVCGYVVGRMVQFDKDIEDVRKVLKEQKAKLNKKQ